MPLDLVGYEPLERRNGLCSSLFPRQLAQRVTDTHPCEMNVNGFGDQAICYTTYCAGPLDDSESGPSAPISAK